VFLFTFAVTAPVGVGIGIALADINAGAQMVLYALATGFFIYIGASEVRQQSLAIFIISILPLRMHAQACLQQRNLSMYGLF
jgi:hypothetical protein